MPSMSHIARLLGSALALGLILCAGTAGAETGRLAVAGVEVWGTLMYSEGCGTRTMTSAEAEGVEMALRRWHDEVTARPAPGVVRVAVHVITSRGEGSVSDAQVAELIRRLNSDYMDTGYGFQLVRLDRTENPGWFKMTPGSGRERQAKQSLAIDPAHHLNLYVCGPAQVFGWASYPWSASEGDDTHGVVIHYASLSADGSLGRAAAHEVGHYLGMQHDDEIHFMATDDGSQVERMREVVPVFRPSLFNPPAAPAASTPEIVPGVGAEPEEGRVLAYRGAFPNPFRAETAVRFTLPTRQLVSLRIYSVTGQLVRTLVDAALPPGDHSAMFRADDLPSGAYFALLRVGKVQMSRTVMLVR
jgi:hypothetical protein